MRSNVLLRPIQFLLFLFLLFGGLYYAKPFLVPICIAGLMALLVLPVSKKLESKGWRRSWSSLSCILIILIAVALIITLLSVQVKNLARDTDKIEMQVKSNISRLQAYINNNFGVPPEKQAAIAKKQAESGSGNISTVALAIAGGTFAIVGGFMLIMVYVFLFLYFRAHFKKFLLLAISSDKRPKAIKIVEESAEASQKYLGGLSLMIVCLWVMYGIGFSIAGVKHALFFAVLCGLLEIIPFIGNLTGTAITALMALADGGTNVLIGVLITYFIIQFVQSYFLEPLIVGAGVDLHPAITIIAIVGSELVWGIAGMVLAIPLVAITKIILDKIPPLKPYGFLLGNEKE